MGILCQWNRYICSLIEKLNLFVDNNNKNKIIDFNYQLYENICVYSSVLTLYAGRWNFSRALQLQIKIDLLV